MTTTGPGQPIRLEILSDPICPWCYIGKAGLDAALERRADHPFVVSWHPFMLNPTMPPQGMDRREYLQAKFGPPDRVVKAYLPVQQAAERAGLAMDLSRITRTPSTLDAHRLIHWAGLEGRQTPVVSALFRAYFAEGRDIGDRATLADIAAGAGLDRAAIARLLASDADAAEVREADATTRAQGVQGVPTFVVAGEYVVTGAQATEFWLQVIDELTGRG
jgi:predicted DsbA family dithiol-disulfide isomerase